MGAATFFIYLTGVCYFGILQEVVEDSHRGSATGIAVVGASLAGFAAPTITGGIVVYSGHFTSAFIAAGVAALVGALAVALLVRSDNRNLTRLSADRVGDGRKTG